MEKLVHVACHFPFPFEQHRYGPGDRNMQNACMTMHKATSLGTDVPQKLGTSPSPNHACWSVYSLSYDTCV